MKPNYTPPPWDLKFHNGAGNVFVLKNPSTANEFMERHENDRAIAQLAPEMFEYIMRSPRMGEHNIKETFIEFKIRHQQWYEEGLLLIGQILG